MANYKITNMSTAEVYLSLPDIQFNRSFIPGREVEIDEKTYTEMTYDQGCQSLIGGGFLKVEPVGEASAKVEVVKCDKEVVSKEEVKKLFEKKDYTKFGKLLKNISPAGQDVVTETAVEMGITDNGFTSLIKKYCNDFDVVKAIAMAHEAEEE